MSLILLLVLPILIHLSLAFWVSGKVFEKILSVFKSYAATFTAAFTLFFVVEYLFRIITFTGLSLVWGIGPLYSMLLVLDAAVHSPVSWVFNGALLVYALFFAQTETSRAQRTASQGPTKNLPSGTLVLTLLIIGAVSVTVGSVLYQNWHRISEPVGMFMVETTGHPMFCKVIRSNKLSEECVLQTLNISNPAETNQCSAFEEGSRSFGACMVNQAKTMEDATLCEHIPDNRHFAKSECVRSFVGTTVWQRYCDAALTSGDYYTASIHVLSARCLDETNVNQPLRPTASTPVWFSWVDRPDPRTNDNVDDLHAWLLSIGADSGFISERGRTPLSAALFGTPNDLTVEEAKKLVDFGVDVNVRDQDDNKAIDYAQRSKNQAVYNYLLQFEDDSRAE